MPTNLEIKARTASLNTAEEIALGIGARYECEMAQTDTYFTARSGRLKLREVDGRRFELIGYRRAEETARRVSDFTILRLDAAEPLKSILIGALGIRGVVTKRRKLFRYHSTRIHLDHVGALGAFLEFETEVNGSLDDAREELTSLISLFRIEEKDFFKVSYIDLLLARRENDPPPG